MKRSRKEMELGGSLLTGKKSISELFSRIITNDEINYDYIIL